MSIKKSIILTILILFAGFAAVVGFVINQYNQSTQGIERSILSQLSRKVILVSEDVRALVLDWKKSAQTASQDSTLPQAIEGLLKGFEAYQPSTDALKEERERLEKYIKENLLPKLQERQADVDLLTLLPSDPKTIGLQNAFLVENTFSMEEKQNFLGPANDTSDYVKAHNSFHSFLLALMVQAEAEDLLLIDPTTGMVFYSASKEIDFANNLQSGFLANSNLAALFKKISADLKADAVNFVDYAFYIPSLAEPMIFFGLPIKIDGTPKAILVLKFSIKKMNDIIQSEKDPQQAGQIPDEDRFLVGSDFLMHSNSKLYMQNSEEYIKKLIQAKTPQSLIDRIKAYDSTAFLLEVKYPSVYQGLTGTQGTETAKNSLGEDLFIGFAPIDLTDFNLVAILTSDKNEALRPTRLVAYKTISTVIGLFLLILAFSLFLLRINLRLERLVVEKTKDLNEKNIALNDTLMSLMQTQEQLILSEKLVSNVINSMPSPMIILDKDQKIILWNQEAEHAAKVPLEEAKEKPFVSLFPMFTNNMNKVSQAVELKEPQKIDKMMDKRSDGAHYFEALMYPLLGESMSGSAVLLQDITQKIKLNENLQQQDKMASIGVLTAGIAHEMNNPVSFIIGSIGALRLDLKDILELLNEYFGLHSTAEDLKEKLKSIETQKEQLGIEYTIAEIDSLLKGIEDGGQKTAAIVRDLRTFSRLDEGDRKKADLQDGLDSTITLLRHSFHDRIELVKEYNPIPKVDCFPGQINQVFMNIITNAVESIKGKGTIWLKTEQVGDSVAISIRDNGVGISDEIMPKIFEPFFTTKDVGKGKGVGLSISFAIITEHGGTIHVNSEVGVGSEFIITLPIVSTHP